MAEYILARANGRNIPHEDKIFGISNRAKAMIAEKGADKVINATIGTLLDVLCLGSNLNRFQWRTYQRR